MLLLLLQSFLIALALSLPLAARWQIDRHLALAGAAVAGVGAALASASVPAGSLLLLLLVQATVALAILLAMVVLLFHRDPERLPPEGEGIVLSPADGKILYVKDVPGDQVPTSSKQGFPFRLEELAGSRLLAEGGWLIGIGMNLIDVHVNRAPIRGEVVLSEFVRGASLSLKRPAALLTNTRLTTLIEGAGLAAAVIQITSRLVRHIRPYIRKGDLVEAGQRIGMIRFGSQVDLLLPRWPGLRLECRPQQRVKAGETVIARHGETRPDMARHEG